jgi:hypothetical protein
MNGLMTQSPGEREKGEALPFLLTKLMINVRKPTRESHSFPDSKSKVFFTIFYN